LEVVNNNRLFWSKLNTRNALIFILFTTISRNKPDHGENFVPGAERAPANQAPEALDHFKRGYHERANLRDRETGELTQDNYTTNQPRRPLPRAFDALPFTDVLCRPGCNVMYELDCVRDSAPANFATGKPITAILSQLARRRKIGIANAVWDWMDSAGIEKNVYHYNTMISVCEKTKDHRRAMQLFHEMERRSIQKNEVT
jgi:pentatricopeptide repeat protein